MAKKKAKVKKTKVKKAKKVKKLKKVKKIVKKAVKKSKPAKKTANKITKAAAPKIKEKLLGRIEHYFDKIQVAALSVKAPFKVGDTIHIKGHTTDFNQTVESMQIEHESIQKVKKGDDVGIKMKEFVRENDKVYLAEAGKTVVAKPAPAASIATAPARPKSQFVQTSIFEAGKVITPRVSQSLPPVPPAPKVEPAKAAPKPEPKAGDPYKEKKFFSF